VNEEPLVTTVFWWLPARAQLERARYGLVATRKRWLPAALCLFLISQDTMPFSFEDVTAKAGIHFQEAFGSANKTSITDVNGTGAAVLDFNNDGLMDIYFVNGARPGQKSPGNVLYKNNGDGTFTDVTEKAGLADFGWCLGVVAADYDNDGWTDLYVTKYGRNTLYHNNGDGTFTDVTEKAGVGKTGYSTGATFGDYDRDGFLDLFVTNYLEFDPKVTGATSKDCSYKGVPVFCGPGGFKGGANILYHNNGDGTFSDVTRTAGVESQEPHYSFTAVFEDFDLDGWPDLYVANDSTANYLYKNLGNGKFKEIGFESGTALSEDGRPQASMGVAVGDYNNDALPDLFVTNFSDDYSTLYRNEGKMRFSDRSYQSGLAQPSFSMLKWGAVFEDFDNDGFKDLFVANGHIYPDVDRHDVHTTYKHWLQLFHTMGGKTFTEVGEAAGVRAVGRLSARSAVAADFDNDGGVDVAVTQIDGPALLLKNQSRRGNWIIIRLEGRKSNRSAVGARVQVKTKALTQWNSVRSGGSFISQNDQRLHFGLGSASVIDEIDVSWPSGARSHVTEIPANQILTIVEQP